MKTIGITFPGELKAAGLLGLPFSWSESGQVLFGVGMTEAQKAAVLAVVAAHDSSIQLPPVVPGSVTKYQCCVVLARHGLLTQTNAFFDAMPVDDERRLAWTMAATVTRISESTLAAASHLGLSERMMDSFFTEASQVE